jgi:poly(A) polymerase
MQKEKRNVALNSLLAALAITFLKLIVGLSTLSLGILSEAAHSGLDLVAALVTLLSVRVSDKPADAEHQYGHGKVENFSAFIETGLLLLTCIWIVWEAVRRDFTINALYFDPETESIWDYVGGVVDIRARRLRLIGPPVTRFREDPVRMLRAVRLAAKLGLTIDRKSEEPILRLAPLMQNVPPARLFEEMQKLLLSGHAVETLKSLRAHGLSHGLLPLLDVILEQPLGTRFIDAALAGTDLRVRADKGVSPAFLFAALLWHEVLATWKASKERGDRPLPALFDAMDRVLHAQAERIAIPRRFEATMKEIWSLQPRFEQRAGSRPVRLLEHPRFRAAYDFLTLRAASGEVPQALADWWTRFQDVSPEEQQAMLKPDEAPKKRRRARRSHKAHPESADEAPAPRVEE